MNEIPRTGEVIEATTTGFTAECYELYQSPPLGSLVKSTDGAVELYGVVYHATTTSLDPGRRPIARGRNEVSEEAIYQSSPQLIKLLRSEFSALMIGHRQEGQYRYYLPPQPAHIHSFVYQCPPEEVREFSQSLDFLSTIINSRLPLPADELITACLRYMSQAHDDRKAFLVAAGKELAVQLCGNFNQLKTILGRLNP